MGSFISTIISYDLGYPNGKNTKNVIKGAGFKKLRKPRLLMHEPIIMDLPIALLAVFTWFVFQLHEHKFVGNFYQKNDFTATMFESFLSWVINF